MSIYSADGSTGAINGGDLTQTEIPIYGSSRLGEYKPNIDVQNTGSSTNPTTTVTLPDGTTVVVHSSFTRGLKAYELSNHLGNVLVTVSDEKADVDLNHDGVIDYYTAVVISAQDYYPGGMLMPGRTYTTASSTPYRFGFNGQEKSNETDPNGNLYDAEYWEYDSRIERRWNIEPLIAKYPGLSGYVALQDNPVNASDPDGKDVIFVNGYRPLATGSASDRDPAFQQKLKDSYWDEKDKYPGFTNDVENYFNDHTEHFVSGDHWKWSTAHDRIAEGKELGIKMVSSEEIKVSKTNNIMTIVMHSQGNAEGLGIAEGIIEQAKKQGVTVTVNLVFLSVHQPADINKELTADLAKRGIQFTYANDDNYLLKPQAKQPGEPDLKGVADANAVNKNWKTNGIPAHSATHTDPAAFKAIVKLDKEKHIFVTRPQSN